MRTFLLTVFLLAPGFAQAPLKPVSFALTVTDEDGGYRDALWRELRQNRNLMVASRRPDLDIYSAITEINERGRFFGYAVALLVVKDNKYELTIYSGPGREPLAQHVAKELTDKYLRKR